MKAFRFTLQPLRIIREQKEREAQQRYAEKLRACEEAAARVQAASEELTTCWKSLRDHLASGVTGTELLRTRAWCNVLELRMRERTGALEKARHAVDAVWKEMIVATSDREALDRLEEKRRRAYEREAQRLVQRGMDEMATQRSGLPAPLQFNPSLKTEDA
jgi:flagellar export protein FliJ